MNKKNPVRFPSLPKAFSRNFFFDYEIEGQGREIKGGKERGDFSNLYHCSLFFLCKFYPKFNNREKIGSGDF